MSIYLNGALLGYSKKFIDDHFDEIVAFAEIEKFLDMPMKNYSSGMVARIAFAIATVIVPDILIASTIAQAAGYPILLSKRTHIPDATAHELKKIRPRKALLIGSMNEFSKTSMQRTARKRFDGKCLTKDLFVMK